MAKPQNSPAERSGTQQSRVVAMQSEYRGPLPPPDMLERYEHIHPGTAERIIQRFEREADHRQAMEHKIVDAQIAHQRSEMAALRAGQRFAFGIAVIGLAVAGFGVLRASSTGHAWAAASIGGASLVALVGAFIYGRKQKPPQDGDVPTALKK